MVTSLEIWLVLFVAIAPILGCTSDSVGTDNVGSFEDVDTSGKFADVVTLTDVDLDTKVP